MESDEPGGTMRSTNWPRIVLAGGVSGVVFNVLGITSALLVGLPRIFAQFGVEPSSGTALLHLGLRFVLGFATALMYAGMRGGLGPGPITAARVGVLVWLVGYLPASVVLHELGVFSSAQMAFALLWGLAEAVLAALVAGWLYRDRSDHGPA